MGQVHYQKPRRRSLRCCYCCTEALSGFLVLMLVATAITLLRYFLEFSSLSYTYGRNTTVGLDPTQEPHRSSVGTSAQTTAMNKLVSLQAVGRFASMSPQSPSQRKMGSPRQWPTPLHPSSPSAKARRPTSPHPAAALSQTSPRGLAAAPEWKLSPFFSTTPSFPPRQTSSTVSPQQQATDPRGTSSGWATSAVKSRLFSSAAPSFSPRMTQVTSSTGTPQQQATDSGRISSAWANSAVKFRLFSSATPSFPPRITQATSSTVSPQQQAMGTVWTSSGWVTLAIKSRLSSSATPSFPPRITQATSSTVSPQQQAMGTVRTSSGWVTLAIKSRLSSSATPSFPPWMTQVTSSTGTPQQQPTDRGWTSSGWATSAIKPRLSSSATPSSPPRMTQAISSTGTPRQQVTDSGWTSSGWTTSSIKSSLSSQLTTATRATPPSRSTSAIKGSLFSPLTTVANRDAKPSSPDDLTMLSLWQMNLLPNTTSPRWTPFSAPHITFPLGGNETGQYFQGSFHLLKEAYHPNYSDHTSDAFRSEALKLENLINNAFAKSALKHQYRKSFVQGLEPGPFRAKFLLKFSNDVLGSSLRPDTVVKEMVRGFQETQDRVVVDISSVQVKDYEGLCLMKPTSLLSVLTGTSQESNSRWDAKRLGQAEDWPWVVGVLKEGISVCIGSLVTESWVLTAGSCVESENSSLYTVKLAPYSNHTSLEWLHSVARIICSSGAPKDVALIQLDKPAPITSSVQPICLPDSSYFTRSGTSCWALGSEANFADTPKAFPWTVTSPIGCLLSSSSSSTCAETSDLKGHLQLSTGGPFLCLGENQQVYLEGTIPTSAESRDESKSTAFPRVAPWVPWIKSQLFP